MSDRSGHGHSRMRSTLIAPKFSVKNVFLCLLFLFFILPHTSHEFFDFKGGAVGHTADTNKPIAKRPFEKKYKFHKIERIEIDDENEEDKQDDDEDDADSKDERAKKKDRTDKKRKNKRQNRENNDEDDDDDDDATTRKQKVSSAEWTESDELPFKRARTAHKEGRAATTSTTRNGKKHAKAKKQRDRSDAGAGNDADDDKLDKSEETKSFFGGSLFGNLFKSASNERADDSAPEKGTSAEDKSTEQKESTNSIIDWLKWLSKRDESAEQHETAETVESAETFLSYLDRWPINSFFPIGKPPKPIAMPRSSHQQKRPASEENANSDEAAPPMSQESFESLLHTLPSFVPSSAHIVNTECRQQLQIFQRQLRGNKLWTLQMLDATGKITSGMLRGNINQFGDFDQCMQVKTVVKVTPKIPVRIRGKYCLAHIEMQTSTKELKVPLHYAQGRGLWRSHFGNPSHFVPRYGIANWGVCIPYLCNGEIVQQMIEANLRSYNSTGVEFHVEVDDDDCYTRPNVKIMRLIKKDREFAMTFFGFCGLVMLCLSSLITKHNVKIKTVLNAVTEMVRARLKRKDGNGEETIVEPEEDPVVADESVAEQDAAVTVDSNTEDEPHEKAQSVLHSLKAMLREIFDAFSPQRTFVQLLNGDHYATQFPIFNILKLGATFALYVSLKYLMIGHLPITNRDKLVRALDQPQSILLRSPMIFMDMLLMISGFLIAYQLAEEMEQKNHIQVLKRMTLKITRFLPTLFVVLLFQTNILPLLGSGPLWTNLVGQNTRLCEQQMWRNFFSVQNAIDFEETCSPMTIQLALEVQLYMLGPLIVWLYYTDADAAFFIYGALHAMSVAARYSRTQREYLSMTIFHGMNVSKFYRTANLLFSSPISRATPYLLGIGTGLLHRSQAGTIEIASELIPVGWFFAALSIFWCFWSPSVGMRTDFVYRAGDAASYAAWCPLIMGLALAWCIFMFPKEENSILHYFTTTRPVLFLSRITFPIQLMTYVVVLYNTATVSEPRKYQFSDLMNFNEIGVILFGSIILAFIIDVPAQHVRKIIINRLFIDRPTAHEHDQDVEPSSGAEASEPEGEAETETEVEVETDKEEQTKQDVGVIWNTGDVVADVVSNTKVEDEEEEEEEGVEDKEQGISGEEEVKSRPEKGDSAEETINFTRRRRRISDD